VSVDVQSRHARLFISRVDPWSVAKAAFMMSLGVAVIIVVAISALWFVLDFTGVFVTVTRNLNEVVGSAASNVDLMNMLDFTRVLGIAVIIGALEVILVSLLAAIFAVMYNLTVGLTGGVEVVLTDAVN